MNRLKNKIAVVTGGNSGIGKTVVNTFLKEGATVIFTSRTESKNSAVKNELIQYGNVDYVTADVTSISDCHKIIDYVITNYGCIDILINNAGISDRNKSIANCNEEYFDRVIKTDMYSTYYMSKYALEYMAKAKTGCIINTASIGGCGVAGISYSAAKAGVAAMTVNIAIDYLHDGIRCNAVAPGRTVTEMMSAEELLLHDGVLAEKVQRFMDFSIPPNMPEDMANTMLFLASEEGRGINGKVIYVDGGSTLFH